MRPRLLREAGAAPFGALSVRFEGDTIYSRSEVLETKDSKSRPNIGVVTVKTTGYDQDGTVVITFKRTLMVYRRGMAPKIARPGPEERT